MPNFISLFQATIIADDEVAAIAATDDIKGALERDILDPDEMVEVIETIPYETDPTPVADVINLRRARNVLLRTRSKDNYDLARSLDQAAYILEHKHSSEVALMGYDWSIFMLVLKEIIVHGGNPLEH